MTNIPNPGTKAWKIAIKKALKNPNFNITLNEQCSELADLNNKKFIAECRSLGVLRDVKQTNEAKQFLLELKNNGDL